MEQKTVHFMLFLTLPGDGGTFIRLPVQGTVSLHLYSNLHNGTCNYYILTLWARQYGAWTRRYEPWARQYDAWAWRYDLCVWWPGPRVLASASQTLGPQVLVSGLVTLNLTSDPWPRGLAGSADLHHPWHTSLVLWQMESLTVNT